MPRIRSCLLLILLLASLMVILPGCGDYRAFTLQKGMAHFSFEYPLSFEEPYTEIIEEGPFQHTAVVSRYMPKGEEERPATFNLEVTKSSPKCPDAKTALESFIKIAEQVESQHAIDPTYGDFKLLERYPVTVAGVNGELIAFSCWWVAGFYVGAEQPEVSAIVRTVYFDYDGLIWEISFWSHADRSEEDKTHFEHMLKTFKILD